MSSSLELSSNMDHIDIKCEELENFLLKYGPDSMAFGAGDITSRRTKILDWVFIGEGDQK